jgi:tRNA pseudouridine55 synthase
LAAKFGTLAHLTVLRRTQVDPFVASTMVTLAQLGAIATQGLAALDALLIPADQALGHLSVVEFDVLGRQALLQGQSVSKPGVMAGELVRMVGPDGIFLGLGEANAGAIHPKRLFVKSATGQ